ncbi:MAG: sulfurtransferase TusA family protein [Anaerolineae bacterium]|nr:sulfurtransferase TusA family protein [Anaerolineae bacterium]
MTTILVDQVLDCSGLLCPLPVVKATKAIKQMEIGQVLKMIATDPGAPPDMAAWSRQTGHEILEQSADGNKFIFLSNAPNRLARFCLGGELCLALIPMPRRDWH